MILLDTHVVIWLAQDYQQISARAQSAIEEARAKDGGLAISCITLLEIARLASRRRIQVTSDVETIVSEIERRFVVFSITGSIAVQAFELPKDYPNDPVDRILGATALIEDIPLLTADTQIRKSRAVPTIW